MHEANGLAGERRKPPGEARLFEAPYRGRESLLIGRREIHAILAERKVSRSNVYASIRRIHRKLGTQTVAELVALAQEAGLTA